MQPQAFRQVEYDEQQARQVYEGSVVTDSTLREVYYIVRPDAKPIEPHQLSTALAVELIDKKLFDKKKKTAVNYLVADNAIKKTDSVITLSFNDDVSTIFRDNVVSDETHSLYTYVGQVPVLNQYVIHGLYWETQEWILFDKNTGAMTGTFNSLPFVSPDRKYIISLSGNVYNTSADLSVDRVTKNGTVPEFSTSFKNWMPDSENAFYGKDGWFYVPVIHSSRYWNERGEVNEPDQYIRIRLLVD